MPIPAHARIGLLFGAVVLIWGVSSEIAAAFQCRGTKPWHMQGSACFDRVSLELLVIEFQYANSSQSSFWNSFNIINILTDVFLVLWPSSVIHTLHTTLSRRLVTIALFCMQIPVCPPLQTHLSSVTEPLSSVIGAVVAQLVFSKRAASSNDPSFDLWPAVLCTQIVQALSITAACILYLGPFLESLESGMIRSDDLRRNGLGVTYGSGTSKGTRKCFNLVSLSPKSSSRAVIPSSIPLRPLQDVENTATVETEESHWKDGQSETSQTRIIKYTTSWSVATEPRLQHATLGTS